ncbi:hypothetical protein IW261DRAFT_1426506 [Armillaria novae-zelandiae]|uniref:Uncharacterized protein n=1 Tax=Armillaria novae-zelandiae TaxID=153914 RepID=A0AA39NKY3_9AGAR|nr:hypothetical protein IW261DRAFT_1426506 [Armillaria novae-zelandiae]
MSNRTTAADRANHAPARSRSQPTIENKSPSTTPILDAIKLRTMVSRTQGGATSSTAQRGKTNAGNRKPVTKPKHMSGPPGNVMTDLELDVPGPLGNDHTQDSGPEHINEGELGSEPPERANVPITASQKTPTTAKEDLCVDQPDDMIQPTTSDAEECVTDPPTTPKPLPHFKKRKSEVEEDTEAYEPGTNTFFPLLQVGEPAVKKACNELVEETTEDFEGSDEDDGMNTRQASLAPSQDEAMEGTDDGIDDDDEVHIVTTVRTLKVNAPKAVAKPTPPPEHTMLTDPFVRRLPGHEEHGKSANADPGKTCLLMPRAPPSTYAQAAMTDDGLPSSNAKRGNPPSELALMVAPTAFAHHMVQPARNRFSVSIYQEQAGMHEPHSIPPQHIFHNCEWTQVTDLFSSQKDGDILIVIWGMEYRNLAYSTEVKIEATLKEYFKNDALNIQITPPVPPPAYQMKGPPPSNHQPFIQDHMGTPFTFYVRGLEPDEKAQILKETFIPTSQDSYLILDATDFVTDFIFTIDGINADPDQTGQSTVEKLLKDRLYTSQKVWSFLANHHDAINLTIPADEIPALVILWLEARGIWIEGRQGEPGRQAWNIWIAHPTKVPSYHLDWLAALRSVFPISNGTGFGGTARIIRIPFFCKGCKGESHPTAQCPLKEQLRAILKRPQDKNAQRGKPKTRGGRGGYLGKANGRFTND